MPQSANFSLFDDEPDKTLSLVQVLALQKPATKAEQTFHRLVTQIALKREQLAAWQAFGLRFEARLVAELPPLQTALRERQRQMADLLDELLDKPPATGKRLGKAQRAKLRQLLLNLLSGLLEGGQGADDPKLEALYDKYADVPLAQERQNELDMTQAMLQEVFGMEIDQNDAASAEELLQRAQQTIQDEARARLQQEQARREAKAAKGRSKAGQARMDAAQAQREKAAAEIGQTVCEVYRKLASALHPDRESDPAARQHKTELMQRVNQAYDANDLLTLLGLQLEIEQIDADHLASMSPQRVAHFNQILREQLKELDAELSHCMHHWREPQGRGGTITPANVEQAFEVDLLKLRAALGEIEDDLVAFRDPVRLRAALKHYQLDRDDDDIDGLDELLDVFDVLSMAPRPGKKRRKS